MARSRSTLSPLLYSFLLGLYLVGCSGASEEAPALETVDGPPASESSSTEQPTPKSFDCSVEHCEPGEEFCYRSYLDGQPHKAGCVPIPEGCTEGPCMLERARSVEANLNEKACTRSYVAFHTQEDGLSYVEVRCNGLQAAR